MGNIGTMIKRFLSNKNTVTLIAIIVCTVILYGFYNWRVKSAVTTTYVCYATQPLAPRTEITAEMVNRVKVLSSQVTQNMIRDCGEVIGKNVSYATEIQANSYFFEGMVMEPKDMPDSSFSDIPDNYYIYNMAVTFESTYGNSIFPGNYIDLFMRTENDTDELVYGKFIRSIKVLGVKDDEGHNVFETTMEIREPSQLLFAVPEDLYLLLKRAEYLGIELVPVPKNSNYSAKASDTLVDNAWFTELIKERTADIPNECIEGDPTGIFECPNKIGDNTGDDDNQGGNQDNPNDDNRDNRE